MLAEKRDKGSPAGNTKERKGATKGFALFAGPLFIVLVRLKRVEAKPEFAPSFSISA